MSRLDDELAKRLNDKEWSKLIAENVINKYNEQISIKPYFKIAWSAAAIIILFVTLFFNYYSNDAVSSAHRIQESVAKDVINDEQIDSNINITEEIAYLLN
ncbi:hypothetical protein KA977_05100 [Candidatus Dependentiae bacterium]|nr:hypothetical protein [Candidatus Dependentiae bacterium]